MNILKSFSIYTLTSLVNASLPFLLLPVLTAYLTPSEYGLLAIIQIFIVFTIPIVSLNINSAIQVNYHHLNNNEFAVLVSSILLIPLSSIIFVLCAFFFFAPAIRIFIDIPTPWILLIPLIAIMQVVPQTVLYIYMMSERAVGYGKFQISLSALNLLLSLLLVVIFLLGWKGRLLAILFSYSIYTVIGLYLLYKMKLLVLEIDKKYIIEALKLGAPLILHVVSGILFMMSDRLFISYYLGNSEVGMYAVGAQVAMIAMIVQQSFNQAWVPFLFKNLKTNVYENDIKIVKISYVVFLFFMMLPFIVYLLSYPVFDWLIDKKFSEARQYVFWIAIGYSLMGMYKVVTNYIFYEKRTGLLSVLTFSSLILNLILNYIFIHKFGTMGVAYATAITVGVFFVVVFLVARKVHDMPWLYFLNRNQK